ncbi:hypothetical protein DYB34_005882 [Aphanomyces astaci]|uniref:Uncharacterized protein n=1 Tax=Aphanomyces astaci TaxID=112090 RepID=A0A418BEZ3_APHAT|nr:hypothetical protein DYB34_005882 [Aphanomyces astaci]
MATGLVPLEDDDGARVSTPGRKREADGSPDVSPPTDRPETRSPLKRPALASAADLALVPTTPLARTGTDGPTLTVARTGTDDRESMKVAAKMNVARAQVTNEANEALLREAEKNALSWEDRTRELQGQLALKWEQREALLVRDMDSDLLVARRLHEEVLSQVQKDAERVLEVRRREDHLRHDGLMSSLREELRTLKRNHQEEILRVREAARDEDTSKGVAYDLLQSQYDRDLASARDEVQSKASELESVQEALRDLSFRESANVACGNCQILEKEKRDLREALRERERILEEEVQRRQRMERVWEEEHRRLRESEETVRELQESILTEQNRHEQTLLSEQGRRQDLEQLVQEQFMTLTQERAQSGEDPSPETRDQLERERHTNEEVLRQVEEARSCLETEKLQLRGQEATLFRERSVQDLTLSRAYAELERQRVQLQVEQRAVDLQQRTPQKMNNAPYATYGIPTLSRMGSPSKGSGITHTTFTTAPLLPATRSNTSTPRRAFDQTCFMQQTEVLTESASLRMPPTFTVRDTTPLPFVPTAAPMSRPNRDADSYPSSGAYGQQLGAGYTQSSPRATGSGPGAATGVVTQVERILPHLLEVDRMGVIMVDPSVAEVALRDLLVVEDLEGTTVVLLALREAAPEETALYAPKFDSVDRTIPLEHFLAKFDTIQKEYGLNDTQVVRIFDDRLTSCGEFIQKILSRKMAEITDNSHRKSTETVREYAWRIADASREAGLQANRAVVMMINGCSDAEVAACLRGASVRPETIEISLDYLIERDVDIDRRTDGSRSAPRTTPVAPSTPTRSTRNTSRTQSSSTPNGNLQELQASISRLQRDMTSLTTSNNDQFSSIQDVVAMISTDNLAGNNPATDYRSAACPGTTEVGVRDKPERDPEDDQDPEDKLNRIPATLVRRLTEILWHLRVPPPSSPGPSRGSGAHCPPSRKTQVTLGSQEPLLETHEPVARYTGPDYGVFGGREY